MTKRSPTARREGGPKNALAEGVHRETNGEERDDEVGEERRAKALGGGA